MGSAKPGEEGGIRVLSSGGEAGPNLCSPNSGVPEGACTLCPLPLMTRSQALVPTPPNGGGSELLWPGRCVLEDT